MQIGFYIVSQSTNEYLFVIYYVFKFFLYLLFEFCFLELKIQQQQKNLRLNVLIEVLVSSTMLYGSVSGRNRERKNKHLGQA